MTTGFANFSVRLMFLRTSLLASDADLPGIGWRQRLSVRLNLLNRHWSQYKQAEENKNETSLPLLWPQPPQIDSYGTDRSTKEAYD